MVSESQLNANRENAQHSTGPITPEGKAAVRFNALRYGLRAESLIIPGEDPEEYAALWEQLEAEWQPQTATERILLSQMASAEWMTRRAVRAESRIYPQPMPPERQLALLERVSAYRTRLERSFANAMRDLERLQQKRRASTGQPAAKSEPETVAEPAKPSPAAPPPAYIMSEPPDSAIPIHCAPATDSR